MDKTYSYFVSYRAPNNFGILYISIDTPSPYEIWEMVAKKVNMDRNLVSLCNIYEI